MSPNSPTYSHAKVGHEDKCLHCARRPSPDARPIEEVGHSSSSVVTRIARCCAVLTEGATLKSNGFFVDCRREMAFLIRGAPRCSSVLLPLIYLATANVTNWILCSSLLMLGYVCAGLSIILP